MKRLWLLSEKSWRPVQLGPLERMKEFARVGLEEGFEVHLAVASIEAPPPEGLQLEILQPELLDKIRPGDAVVSSIFLPPRMLFALLRSSIPFHADFYCVAALEGMESTQGLAPWRILQGRRRTIARYRMLTDRAERLYFSNWQQLEFVGGALYASTRSSDPTSISRLPGKSLLAPMGTRSAVYESGAANPYPEALRDRPIFLWGGGIWQWFDTSRLLEAFKLLLDEGHRASLYFLVNKNPSEEASQDSAPAAAIRRARELGVLDRNVFFHDRPVRPSDLSSFLEHCTGGVLSNPATLESLASWRTRYLDLVWAGKPLLANRPDHLADMLEAHGAALVNRDGSAAGLASLVRRLSDDADLARELAASMKTLRTRFSSDSCLAEFRQILSCGFSDAGMAPSMLRIASYLAGV